MPKNKQILADSFVLKQLKFMSDLSNLPKFYEGPIQWSRYEKNRQKETPPFPEGLK
jgi:hypothetical protein